MAKAEEIQEAACRYEAQPYTGWRTRVTDYTPLIGAANQEQLERVRDLVYGIVLDTGADLKTICEYFGWDSRTARSQIGPTIEMAKAELKLAVLSNVLAYGMRTNIPQAKAHTGRHFADQIEGGNVATDTVATTDGLFGGLTVVQTHRDPATGQTVQEPTRLTVVKAA